MKIVVTGDMHLDGSKTPVCRTDTFYETQTLKLQFIERLMEKHNAIHIDAGDIVDKAVGKTPADTLKTIKLIQDNISHMYAILGNHDIVYNNLQYVERSLVSAPISAGIITHVTNPILIDDELILYGFNYSEEFLHTSSKYKKEEYVKIALYHGYVSEEKDPFINGLVASKIVEEFGEDYHFIITADNHLPFSYTKNDCTLINVGSLMRTTISQIDYKPHVYIIDTDDLSYEAVPVPILEGVISTKHKDVVEEKKNTMDSVVNVVKSSEGVKLSFENELEAIKGENVDLVNDYIQEYLNIVCEVEETYVR